MKGPSVVKKRRTVSHSKDWLFLICRLNLNQQTPHKKPGFSPGHYPLFRFLPLQSNSGICLIVKFKITETPRTYRGKALIADPIYQYILFTVPSAGLLPEATEQPLIDFP